MLACESMIQPPTQAVAIPSAWAIDHPPTIMSVVSRPGTRTTTIGTTPNRTRTLRAKATIDNPSTANASQRVPLRPKIANDGRTRTA